MEKDFLFVQGKILNKRPERLKDIEIAGLNDPDIMFIEAFAVGEGVNANNALFMKDDLEKAERTFVGKPVKIRFINNDPTGHGYDKTTGTFDEIVKAVGYIYDAWGSYYDNEGNWLSKEEGGTYKVKVYMAIWQRYYPEIALRLRQLHDTGDLKFSIEAEREFEITPEGYRKCFNIIFNGLAIVKNPAFENARSLMVAEILKEGGNRDMDEKALKELMKKMMKNMNMDMSETASIEEMATAIEAKFGDLGQNITTLTSEKETAETALTTVKEELVTVKGELAEKSAKLDTLTQEKEVAEKTKLGEMRHSKLAKYGEVVKSKEELSEMSGEAFVALLEEAVDNYKPTGTENSSTEDNITGVVFETGKVDKASRKEKLLGLINGLSK
jgi:hypothetical protein